MCRRTTGSVLWTWANGMTGVGDRRHIRAWTVILHGWAAAVGLKTVPAEWKNAFDVRASRDRLSAKVGPTMILNTIAAGGFSRRQRGDRQHGEQNIRDQGNLSHLKSLSFNRDPQTELGLRISWSYPPGKEATTKGPQDMCAGSRSPADLGTSARKCWAVRRVGGTSHVAAGASLSCGDWHQPCLRDHWRRL
jgi:hypothetical protein